MLTEELSRPQSPEVDSAPVDVSSHSVTTDQVVNGEELGQNDVRLSANDTLESVSAEEEAVAMESDLVERFPGRERGKVSVL